MQSIPSAVGSGPQFGQGAARYGGEQPRPFASMKVRSETLTAPSSLASQASAQKIPQLPPENRAADSATTSPMTKSVVPSWLQSPRTKSAFWALQKEEAQMARHRSVVWVSFFMKIQSVITTEN